MDGSDRITDDEVAAVQVQLEHTISIMENAATHCRKKEGKPMQDSNLTSQGLDVATAIAMTLNQMLTNFLPATLITLLLAMATDGEIAAIWWGVAIWLIYSIGSVASLALLQSQSRS